LTRQLSASQTTIAIVFIINLHILRFRNTTNIETIGLDIVDNSNDAKVRRQNAGRHSENHANRREDHLHGAPRRGRCWRKANAPIQHRNQRKTHETHNDRRSDRY
jgi:hypothetical protein